MTKLAKHLKKLDMAHFIKEYGCHKIVNDHKFLKKLKLVENTRLRRVLGYAIYNKEMIQLSSLIVNESYDNIRETLIHEMCHFVAYKVYGEFGHGPRFKWLMKVYFGHEQKDRFHQGILTTTYVKENGKTVVKKIEDTLTEEQKEAKRVTDYFKMRLRQHSKQQFDQLKKVQLNRIAADIARLS